MKIVVCDDNAVFRRDLIDRIRSLLAKTPHLADLSLQVEECSSSEELMKGMRSRAADLLFLDISMPGESGLSAAEIIHKEYPDTLILFVTNFEHYVFYTFRFRPFRFLRKSELTNELPEALLSAMEALTQASRYLPVMNQSTSANVKLSHIFSIEKEKQSNYLWVNSREGRYRYRKNMKDLMEELKHPDFIKIGQSVVVNMSHITAIQEKVVVMSDGHRLPLAPSYAAAAKRAYMDFIRRKSV